MLRRAFVAVVVPMMVGRCVLELVGCVAAKPPESAADKTGALIEKCTNEARAANYVGGVSVEEAGLIYDACIADGGTNAR